MQVSVPQIGLANPRRICSFDCYVWIIIQVVTANTLFIADNPDDLRLGDNPALPGGGIQINQAQETNGPFQGWWKGELWAAGSAPFTFLFQMPGGANSIQKTGGMAA